MLIGERRGADIARPSPRWRGARRSPFEGLILPVLVPFLVPFPGTFPRHFSQGHFSRQVFRAGAPREVRDQSRTRGAPLTIRPCLALVTVRAGATILGKTPCRG